MHKVKTMKRKLIDSSMDGSSNSQNTDESELDKSVRKDDSKISTLKRARTAVDPSEETTTKKTKIDANVAGPSNQNENEKMELDSSAQKNDSTNKTSTSLDDLPPEMLRAVLDHVATDDLLDCRRVNHKWNKLSSKILHDRADKVLRFRFELGNFKRNILVKTCNVMGHTSPDYYENQTENLTDLLHCFKDCTHLPYASFDFDDLALFGSEDMKRFLLIWGKHILCLKMQICDLASSSTLKKLLLEQVPNLKKLEIQFECDQSLDQSFDSSVEYSMPIPQDNALFQKCQLPKLEVLLVDLGYRQFRGIIENILTAACNLKEFVYNSNQLERHDRRFLFYRDSIIKEDLIMLQSLNKLQCLKTINICFSEDLITYWTKSSKYLNLKLRTLNLSFGDIWRHQQLKFDATSVVNQLLESNKVVLEKLMMEPIGLLPGIIFPKLEKLRILNLCMTPYSASSSIKRTMFPQPFEMIDVFPNLKELEMHVACSDEYFPQPLAPLPTIEVLRMYGESSLENKEKLMKMTPNVKSLLLVEDCPIVLILGRETFVGEFQVIVNNLKKLETFGWVIWTMTHHELLHKLDAAMTGLTENFCKKLAVKFRNKDKLSAQEITSIEPKRKHSSILDLKDLKKLDVMFISTLDINWMGEKEDDVGYEPTSDFYKTGFTKVSEFLAFDLMPNVKISVNKDLLD